MQTFTIFVFAILLGVALAAEVGLGHPSGMSPNSIAAENERRARFFGFGWGGFGGWGYGGWGYPYGGYYWG